MSVLTIALIVAVAATGLYSQEAPKASLHVWSDQFGGADGAVFYPQYTWNMKAPAGRIGGYGFGEVAPYEEFFTNHLVVYTPNVAKWFSVHTETGGVPNVGKHFFQIAPRINVVDAIPALKRPMDHMFIAVLPRFIGIRPNNLLAAGATNRFTITKTTQGWIEGYCRFFPDGSYYGEYWFMVHSKKETSHLSWGVLIHDDSSERISVGFGARISLF